MLSDRNAGIIEALGLVDAHGTIIHRYSSTKYRDRPDIDLILAQLRRESGR